MVEFITLLLGLTIGHKPVQVAVGAEVAHVEMRLDGKTLGKMTQEPWYLAVDFSQALQPRLLEALAFDAEGQQTGYARQLVNYARPNYQAVLVLNPAKDGQPANRGQVFWAAILNKKPKNIDLQMDGESIPVTSDGRFRLPPYDPQVAHTLVAELRFNGGEFARADLTFGGAYAERVTSALTAIPLMVPPGNPRPKKEDMTDWFLKDGQPLQIFSVPEDDARLMIVLDPANTERLKEIRKNLKQPESRILQPKDSVHFVPIYPLKSHTNAFRAIEVNARKVKAGFWPLITKLTPTMPTDGQQRLWDGVAAAGMSAAETDLRSAVVVLMGPKRKDTSRLTAEQAIHYLASVRVPCFLWAPTPNDLPKLEQPQARHYVGAEGLVRLAGDLDLSLKNQHMVWLEGEYFPQQITLSKRANDGTHLAQ